MSTILDFKTAVALELSKSNATVNVPKRDSACGEALLQYTNEHDWSWNETSAAKSTGGAVPTDFNTKWRPKGWYASGTTSIVDVEYVAYPYYITRSDAVFATSGGLVYTNVTSAFNFIYQKKPQTILTDGTDNATTLTAPDITTPTKLAVALYFLRGERDEDNFDRFMKEYYRLLPEEISIDQQIPRYVRPQKRRRAMGWNQVGI